MNHPHTPAPWLAVWMPDEEGDTFFDGFIHPLPNGGHEEVEIERRANACLIAAAPAMLEALKRCEAMVSTPHGPPNWDWVREVIAKAEGGSDAA